MSTQIGSQFTTGEKAPVSGNYRFVRHLDGTTNHTPAEAVIPLSAGETFPPCKSCNKAAIWQLERYA
jgi:hypothetical protein